MEHVVVGAPFAGYEFLFGIVLFLVAVVRGYRPGILPNKSFVFDKKKLPYYFLFILSTAIVSLPIGSLIASNFDLVLKFAGLNVMMAGIMGLALFLFKLKDKP